MLIHLSATLKKSVTWGGGGREHFHLFLRSLLGVKLCTPASGFMLLVRKPDSYQCLRSVHLIFVCYIYSIARCP